MNKLKKSISRVQVKCKGALLQSNLKQTKEARCQRNKIILEEIRSLSKVLNDSWFKFSECKDPNVINAIESKFDLIEKKFDQILDAIKENKEDNSVIQSKVAKIENEFEAFKEDVNLKKILERLSQIDESISLFQKDNDLHLKKMMNVISRIFESNEQVKEFIFTEKEGEANLETSLRKILTESLSVAGYTLRGSNHHTPSDPFDLNRFEKILENIEKIGAITSNTCDYLREAADDRRAFDGINCERLENRIEFATQELVDKIESEFRRLKNNFTYDDVSNPVTIKTPNNLLTKSLLESNDADHKNASQSKMCNKIEPKRDQYQNAERSESKLMNPKNCNQLHKSNSEDGTYIIFPINSRAFRVYCDMEPDGGWTVIMRRGSFESSKRKYHISFNHAWNSYKSGFGDVEDEFWLGNENIHSLTTQGTNELQVDIEFFNGSCITYHYDSFKIDNEKSNYRIKIGKPVNNGEALFLLQHNNLEFSTYDRYHGYNKDNCAKIHAGGWWFQNVRCFDVFLTGIYKEASDKDSELHSIFWPSWQPLKAVQMKIKPKVN